MLYFLDGLLDIISIQVLLFVSIFRLDFEAELAKNEMKYF